jgi:hypothetical protein
MAQHRLGGTGPQRVAIINRVATSQRRVDHRHGLVADIGVTGRVTQIDVGLEQLPHTEMLGQGAGAISLAPATRRPSSKVTPMASRLCDEDIEKVPPSWDRMSVSQTSSSQVRGTVSRIRGPQQGDFIGGSGLS